MLLTRDRCMKTRRMSKIRLTEVFPFLAGLTSEEIRQAAGGADDPCIVDIKSPVMLAHPIARFIAERLGKVPLNQLFPVLSKIPGEVTPDNAGPIIYRALLRSDLSLFWSEVLGNSAAELAELPGVGVVGVLEFLKSCVGVSIYNVLRWQGPLDWKPPPSTKPSTQLSPEPPVDRQAPTPSLPRARPSQAQKSGRLRGPQIRDFRVARKLSQSQLARLIRAPLVDMISLWESERLPIDSPYKERLADLMATWPVGQPLPEIPKPTSEATVASPSQGRQTSPSVSLRPPTTGGSVDGHAIDTARESSEVKVTGNAHVAWRLSPDRSRTPYPTHEAGKAPPQARSPAAESAVPHAQPCPHHARACHRCKMSLSCERCQRRSPNAAGDLCRKCALQEPKRTSLSPQSVAQYKRRKLVGLGLHEVEQELFRACREVELLCELDLSDEETEHLARSLGSLIEQAGPIQATRQLSDHLSHVLAAYLAFEGVRSYSQGEYWTAVCDRTGLPRDGSCARWAAIFRNVLVRHKLAVLHDRAGNFHVSEILLHAGIPHYCLRDYLQEFVIPAVVRPELAGLAAVDLIATWERGRRFQRGDKPIRVFLLHGGREAEDFLDRSLSFVRAALVSGAVPPPAEHGLPGRIGQTLEQLLRESESQSPRRAQGGRRLGPRLTLDPWGAGVSILLPEQIIECQSVRWEVTIDGRDPVRHTPRTWRTPGGLQLHEESLRPNEPFRSALVRLVLDEQPTGGDWKLQGVSPDHPVICFHGESRKNISMRRLEPRTTWFVVPRQTRIQGAREACSAVRLPGSWCEYEARCLELEGSDQLSLGIAESTIAIPIRANAPSIELQGPRVSGVTTSEGSPVFSDWPILVRLVGIRGDRPLQIEAGLGASPASAILAENEETDEDSHQARVRLTSPGSQAFGSYSVGRLGALGHSCRTELAVVPGLSVQFGTSGGSYANLRCPTSTIAIERGGRISVGDHGAQQLRFDPGVRDARLVIRRGEAAVSVRVLNPAPRWALVGIEGKAEVISWTAAAIETSRARLDAARSPGLVVDWPVDRGVAPTLVLEREGSPIQSLTAEDAHGVVRFDLSLLLSSLGGDHRGGHARLILNPGGHLVGRITAEWSPKELKIDCGPGSGHGNRGLSAQWTGDRLTGNRELVLFDLQRPYTAPLSLAIPDEAASCCSWELPASGVLEGGRVRAWLRLRDPWAPDPLPWDVPSPLLPGVLDFHIEAFQNAEIARGRDSLVLKEIETALGAPDPRTALGILAQLSSIPADCFGRVIETLAVLERFPTVDLVHQTVRRRLQEVVQSSHRLLLVALARVGQQLPVEATRHLVGNQDLGLRIGARHLAPYKPGLGVTVSEASDEQLVDQPGAAPADRASSTVKLSDAELDSLGRVSPALVVFLEAQRPSEEAASARQRFERLLGESAVHDLQPLREGTCVAIRDEVLVVEKIDTTEIDTESAHFGPILPAGLLIEGKRLADMAAVTLRVLPDARARLECGEEGETEDRIRLDLEGCFPSKVFGCWDERWRPDFEAVSDGSPSDLSAVGESWGPSAPLLEPSGVGSAVRECLEKIRRLPKAERLELQALVCSAVPLLERGLREQGAKLPPALLSAIQRRRRPEASRFWLLHWPNLSFSVALLQRLLARRELQAGFRAQQLIELGRKLQVLSPLLFERDLCLAELALAWFREQSS